MCSATHTAVGRHHHHVLPGHRVGRVGHCGRANHCLTFRLALRTLLVPAAAPSVDALKARLPCLSRFFLDRLTLSLRTRVARCLGRCRGPLLDVDGVASSTIKAVTST